MCHVGLRVFSAPDIGFCKKYGHASSVAFDFRRSLGALAGLSNNFLRFFSNAGQISNAGVKRVVRKNP